MAYTFHLSTFDYLQFHQRLLLFSVVRVTFVADILYKACCYFACVVIHCKPLFQHQSTVRFISFNKQTNKTKEAYYCTGLPIKFYYPLVTFLIALSKTFIYNDTD